MKILVAIANYGEKNRLHVERIIDTYHAMPVDIQVVVLSNIPKEFGLNVQIEVGLPSSNPFSLPYAHRKLFREQINNYDFFIYSEDDTLLTWESLQAFIESINVLKDNEIAGFVRFEHGEDDKLYYSTCHSFFRWIPSSVRERGGKLWANYSNEHSACFIVSQQQLRTAIASGGFKNEPHEGRYDMLCSAATDIYTQCGFERLVCIDQIPKFSIHHLPNKYIGKLGLSEKEMLWQIDALRKIHSGVLGTEELFDPETNLPKAEGSKSYREHTDKIINQLVGNDLASILVWGSGDGVWESEFAIKGHKVSVVPMNTVVGEACKKRGLDVLSNDFLNRPVEIRFDVIILRDVLYFIDDPLNFLKRLKYFMHYDGRVIIRSLNSNYLRFIKIRMRKYCSFTIPDKKGENYGFSGNKIRKIASSTGLKDIKISYNVPEKRRRLEKITCHYLTKYLSPYLYLTCKRVNMSDVKIANLWHAPSMNESE